MKTLITVGSLVILAVTGLLYLLQNRYFSPFQSNGEYNSYNIIIVLSLLALIVYGIGFVLSFLTRKKIAYGAREFPPTMGSHIHGFILASIAVLMLLAYMFSILTGTLAITIGILLLILAFLVFK
jgi:hypothetical protein